MDEEQQIGEGHQAMIHIMTYAVGSMVSSSKADVAEFHVIEAVQNFDVLSKLYTPNETTPEFDIH